MLKLLHWTTGLARDRDPDPLKDWDREPIKNPRLVPALTGTQLEMVEVENFSGFFKVVPQAKN